MQFDYNRLSDRRVVYGLLVVTSVMLLAVFAFPRVNGAHRWIKLNGFSIQPSELSKLTLAIFLAYFLERHAGDEGTFWRTFFPCALHYRLAGCAGCDRARPRNGDDVDRLFRF